MTLCWTDISGYMTACWRALAAMPDVELNIIAFEPSSESFAQELTRGLKCRLLTTAERSDDRLVANLIAQTRPQVVYLSGWYVPAYRKVIFSEEFEGVAKWIGVDTPWWGTLRQQVGRLVLPRLLRRVDRVFVAGERAWQYMRILALPQAKVSRGLYGVDYDSFAPLLEQRRQQPGGWPRRFLYIGRYVHEKAIDVLIDAYAKYRASASDPWPLTCCGGGAMEHLFGGHDGVENLGFRQPAELLDVMRRAGAFVLPSRFDPWPLVVVEASAAGLPVIATESCGSTVEMVRPYFNGLTVATQDADALARAMLWSHENHQQLSVMGERGQHLAAAYSAQMWATRWAAAALRDLAARAQSSSQA
jgi:glycosyltransferase involved in cell wall biosynthesis